MSQWKSYSNVAGVPEWSASINQQGSGHTAKAANNTSLVVNATPGAFIVQGVIPSGYSGTGPKSDAIGMFPITPQVKANGQSIANITVTGTTSAYDNSYFVIVANSITNAQFSISTNSTGGITNASFAAVNTGVFNSTITAAANLNIFVANSSLLAAPNGTGATFGAVLANYGPMGESARVHGLGWAQRRAYEGGISTLSAANGHFANGETALANGGSTNATITLTTNATGNLVSGAVTTQGTFNNTSEIGITFNRELHVTNVNITNSTALTGVGDANVIYLTIGNTDISYGQNAVVPLVSNSTGGINNTVTQALTWGGNSSIATNISSAANGTGFWGLFANVQTNTAISATLVNANGTAVGGTYAITANLTPSTGGNVHVSTLGGRAGRVTYEMLVIDRHMVNGTSTVANSVQLPQ
jgi:hypothetical protein